MVTYLMFGLWTWFCLSLCRWHTFKNASVSSVVYGFLTCVLLWPIASVLFIWLSCRSSSKDSKD